MRYLFFALALFSVTGFAQQTAQNLFSHYQSALYQIRIIELGSGNKSSIGSGFQINEAGVLVTNYHVVSEYVYFPEKYRIEYLAANGTVGELSLVNIDVVNDLALVQVQSDSKSTDFFSLSAHLPEQGSSIYSLGNPHDLGMIVVPGTFNGIKKNSFYQRIHFTGSINPGMSGGPVVNPEGEVVGVNVATAGNQIGFLVPLTKIRALVSTNEFTPISTNEYKRVIAAQLMDNQQRLFERLEHEEWKLNELGGAKIPTLTGPLLSCWGDSNSADQEALYLSVENRCSLDEEIFVHGGLRTGGIEIEFEWLESDEFGAHRFYDFFSGSISGASAGNHAGKNDVSNYQCKQDIVANTHDVKTKSILCLRAYKEFPHLYDVLYIGATLNHESQGLISHFTLAGVSQGSAMRFTKQFVGAIAWQ
ncbi:Putative serine protease HhoB [Paraglaciecola mesophila]|uniref:Serine protease HhoB n=1 Tax=Paraglaciecola mesophila TaxID=197222 RepID=A0A857JLC4_9ALTE|nr:serine protease [Paraglaciecola mesophila]QHJ12098.1 Putative serine protease HhoB [Paraglaciecola mesophila]